MTEEDMALLQSLAAIESQLELITALLVLLCIYSAAILIGVLIMAAKK